MRAPVKPELFQHYGPAAEAVAHLPHWNVEAREGMKHQLGLIEGRARWEDDLRGSKTVLDALLSHGFCSMQDRDSADTADNEHEKPKNHAFKCKRNRPRSASATGPIQIIGNAGP